MSKTQIAIQSNLWSQNSILRQKRQNPGKQNYMPFLFKSKRQFIQLKQSSPPVGSYKIQSAFDHAKPVLMGKQDQPQILKQHYIKSSQMGIFKSKQQRFNSIDNQIPGPASYTQVQTRMSHNTRNINKINHNRQNFSVILKKSPSCPAIPDSKLRYGYSKDPNGNYHLITKTQEQIEKQKQKLKQYSRTLLVKEKVEQYHFDGCRLNANQQRFRIDKKQQILQKVGKFINQKPNTSNKENMMSSSRLCDSKISNSRIAKNNIKPKSRLFHSNVKTQDIIRANNQDRLGPGCYNVSLDTLKKGKKCQDFQFFGSSQIRFNPASPNSQFSPSNTLANNPYEHLFKEKKKQLQLKLLKSTLKNNKFTSGKVYKRSFPFKFDPGACGQKEQQPGPGYYEPISSLKKSQGNVVFGSQQRFKDNVIGDQLDYAYQKRQVYGANEQEQNLTSNMKWGNLRKQKIKSPHKQFEPVRQQQIYGIMNEEPSSTSQLNINSAMKKSFRKQLKSKQSPVFLDKCQRFNNMPQDPIPISSFSQEQNSKLMTTQQSSKSAFNGLNGTKGSFISKLSKKQFRQHEPKQNTPGPGAYQENTMTKKSFNIKNQL